MIHIPEPEVERREIKVIDFLPSFFMDGDFNTFPTLLYLFTYSPRILSQGPCVIRLLFITSRNSTELPSVVSKLLTDTTLNPGL